MIKDVCVSKLPLVWSNSDVWWMGWLDGEGRKNLHPKCVVDSTSLGCWRFVDGSKLVQAFSVVTKWLVEFRAQRVGWEGLFEFLQGAVDSTTTRYELILQKDKQLGEEPNSAAHELDIDTLLVPTWPMYDTLTKAFLVCRCWCTSRVISAAYGGHLMSKIPRAIRQGISVVSCPEYKYNFLLENRFQQGTFKRYNIINMKVIIQCHPTCWPQTKCPSVSPQCCTTMCATRVPHTTAGSPWKNTKQCK